MSDLPPPSSPPPDLPPPAPPEVVPATPAPQPPVVTSTGGTPPPVEALDDGQDPQPESAEEKTLGLVMYLLPLLGLFSLRSSGAQGVALVAPLVLWLIKKDQSRYLDMAGKEVVNFNICAVVVFIAMRILWVIGSFIWLGWLFIGLWYVVWLAWLVNTIISAVTANGGKIYRFPLSYRVIK